MDSCCGHFFINSTTRFCFMHSHNEHNFPSYLVEMNSSAHKIDHESFVSNLKGTSVACVIACIAHVPCCIVLLKIAQKSKKPRLLRDICFVVVPMLLIVTVMADYNYMTVLSTLIVLAVMYFRTSGKLPVNDSNNSSPDKVNINPSKQNTYYLTLFKGTVVINAALLSIFFNDTCFSRFQCALDLHLHSGD